MQFATITIKLQSICYLLHYVSKIFQISTVKNHLLTINSEINH